MLKCQPKIKILTTSILAILVFYGNICLGRNSDGTLGLIKLPNEGIPVVLAKGQDFRVISEEPGNLFLIDITGKKIPLNPQWAEKESLGKWVAKVWLEKGSSDENPYSIQLVTKDNRVDINERAVWLFDGFYEYYTFAHVSDIHIKSTDPSDENSVIFEKIIDKINQSDAQFVLLTGDLTHNGSIDEMKTFLKLLNKFTKPTFVCAGNHDRAGDTYEQFFFTSMYAFRYSKDGFIIFDSREYRTADPWDEQDNVLYRYRRELKSSRWTFGVTHRYEFTMGMRTQLTLFVDDPVDFLLYGHTHRENTKEESILPWGKTKVSVVPACKDGFFRIFDIGEGGVFPRPLVCVK